MKYVDKFGGSECPYNFDIKCLKNEPCNICDYFAEFLEKQNEMEDIEIMPGQIWEDVDNKWSPGYDGLMLYITCSQEVGEPWIVMEFQEAEYGASIRKFNENEIKRMKLIGSLKEYYLDMSEKRRKGKFYR